LSALRAGGKPSAQFAKRLGGADMLVDNWLDMRWDPPALLRLDSGVTPTGKPREEGGAGSMSAHILTPETETSTHYFYANSREYSSQ
jgi:hypothetical protein